MDDFERKVKQIEDELEVAEVKIELQTGGFVAGKFWGDKSVRPFVCIHGWLDNAGSFDRLIPLLPRQYSYLAIDLPGHGKSSWNPTGVAYHNFDFVLTVMSFMKEYNWDKISLLTHSLGSNIGFMFASIYPEKIDMLISIDGLKPPIYSTEAFIAYMRDSIEKNPLADQRNQEGQENPYSYDEAIDKICKGSFNSVNKETAPYLLRRGLVPSKKHPSKFCFSKDARMRYNFGFNAGHTMTIELAKRIKIPFLVVKSAQFPIMEKRRYYDETLKALSESNPKFEYLEIDCASHHPHLTEPERIVKIISSFIEKYKKTQSQL